MTEIKEEVTPFNKAMGEISHRIILSNVRRLLPRNQQPNWVLAMEVFGVGSTYGWRICEEAGIDPEAKTLTG
jgi:ribosomal protein S13